IKDFDPKGILTPKESRRFGRFVQFGIISAEEALQDAGITLPRDALIVGGTSRAGVYELERVFLNGGHPTGYIMLSTMASMLSSALAERFRTSGEAITISGACASGAMAIGYTYRAIKEGRAEVALCGGAEAPVTEFTLKGYSRMGVLSRLSPDRAERPFDKLRDGFVLGEGATFLVLEELGHALRRNARVYAEVVGYALVVNPENHVAPSKEAEVEVIKKALEDATMTPEEIEHINTHGTATKQGDLIEAESLKEVFGGSLNSIALSAIKPSTGHMLSGSSAFEVAVTGWAISEGIVPPSIRSEDLDFPLNLYQNHLKRNIKTAMSLSFGFGGVNMAVVLKAFEG
ncbi:MAG: beta-ketoacyl-[acyl-carrier-protein] synthase family protein, partial [Nitrospirae bacterium]